MKIAKTRPSGPSPRSLLAYAGSNRPTLALLGLLAVCILVYYRVAMPARIWLLVVPSTLLTLNFILAIATRGILADNRPLLVFHFALIALVVLALVGRMSHFAATLELARDEVFTGQLENVEQGAWHTYGLERARFANLGFDIRYNRGIKRDSTSNRIAVIGPDGGRRLVEIGDHVPLVVGHYRFYTSHNKGYAPVFEWRPSGGGDAVVGSIHLPAYPAHRFGQALEWRIPGSDRKIWTMLRIEDEVMPADRAFSFRIPERHRLVIRFEQRRQELEPGDQLSLPGGTLRYRELSTWMGYKVDYDWTRPWLLATALVGLAGLFLHYVLKFFPLGGNAPARPALSGGEEKSTGVAAATACRGRNRTDRQAAPHPGELFLTASCAGSRRYRAPRR